MSIKEKKKRLRQILGILRRAYGRVQRPEPSETSEILVQTILSPGSTPGAVEGAYRRLTTLLAGLNEVRAATPAEIAECLGPLHHAQEKAGVVKRALSKVFLDQATLTADFLGEKPPAEAEKYLCAIPAMPRAVARRFLLEAFDAPLVPPDETMKRLWTRIGLIEGDTSDEALCVEMDTLAPKRETYEVFHLLQQHGDRVCVVGTPRCGQCRIRHLCETGKAVKTRPAPKKKATSSKKTPPAPKKAAPKKEAAKRKAPAKKLIKKKK